MFSNEGLVGQHHRLEGLAGILQVVVSQALDKRWLFHIRDWASSTADDAHALSGRGAGVRVKRRLAVDLVRGLEGAGVRLHGLCLNFEEERA